MTTTRVPGSFRDPSGFLFRRDGTLLRQINEEYREEYEAARDGGLHRELTEAGLLVEHEETDEPPAAPDGAWRVIRPRLVPFISYPYEWCFSQLGDAALATIEIQRRALARGFTLKDASAYNIQFDAGRAVLIDTLSFERRREGEPWVAYRQFCRHFLAPLALVALCDYRLGALLRANIDGLDLDLASRLLPWRTRLSLGWQMHVHLHARMEARHADDAANAKSSTTTKSAPKVSTPALLGMLGNLEGLVRKVGWKAAGTEWADYYDATNYDERAFQRKESLVGEYLERCAPKSVWDLGANTGHFSRLAAQRTGAHVVAFDVDAACIDRLWRAPWRGEQPHLLPLVMDLRNPSPALGWDHAERSSLAERGPADALLALALVHHLAIGNNVPLGRVAEFLARVGRHLIIEFVPKEDSQVRRLLASRRDIFPVYHREGFEAAFAERFETLASAPIEGSLRTLYLMRARG